MVKISERRDFGVVVERNKYFELKLHFYYENENWTIFLSYIILHDVIIVNFELMDLISINSDSLVGVRLWKNFKLN